MQPTFTYAPYCQSCREFGRSFADGLPGDGGRLCPYREHEPVSLDGQIAWALLTEGGGQWVRAGMNGTIVGLDLAQCLARPPAQQADPEVIEGLLLVGETAVLKALADWAQELE